MDKILILYLCGVFNITLAIFHILFWKIFNWKITLEKGTKANKIVVQIINVNLIYLFLFMGFFYIYYAKELLQSEILKTFLFGYAGFWVVRFLQQFIFLKQKGKFVIGLTFLFFLGSVLHLIPILL